MNELGRSSRTFVTENGGPVFLTVGNSVVERVHFVIFFSLLLCLDTKTFAVSSIRV